jgi:rRNA-processing protein FCF1
MEELERLERKLRGEIERAKRKLVKQWKKEGFTENFGDKEYRELADKYNDYIYQSKEIRRLLEQFFDWTGDYDGH